MNRDGAQRAHANKEFAARKRRSRILGLPVTRKLVTHKTAPNHFIDTPSSEHLHRKLVTALLSGSRCGCPPCTKSRQETATPKCCWSEMLNSCRALTIASPSMPEAYSNCLPRTSGTQAVRAQSRPEAEVKSLPPFTLNYGRRSTLHAYHCHWDQVNWHSARRALVPVQIREGQRGVDGAAPMAAREA
jgi:hypothetical protein